MISLAVKAIQQKATAKQVAQVIEATAVKFTKEQLLASQKFAGRKDALSAVLVDGESYSFAEADSLLEKFDKGDDK